MMKNKKSLGNFLTIRALSEKFHAEILKLFVFSTQYRNPLEYSDQAMQDAHTGLTRLYECVAGFEALKCDESGDAESVISTKEQTKLSSLEQRFRQAMDNDFNSAQAIGHLFDAAKSVNKIIRKLPGQQNPDDISRLKQTVGLITRLARVIGILNEPAAAFLDSQKLESLKGADLDVKNIEELIAQRNNARTDKDWALSDQIRDQLLSHHIELKDGPNGTVWTVKRD